MICTIDVPLARPFYWTLLNRVSAIQTLQVSGFVFLIADKTLFLICEFDHQNFGFGNKHALSRDLKTFAIIFNSRSTNGNDKLKMEVYVGVIIIYNNKKNVCFIMTVDEVITFFVDWIGIWKKKNNIFLIIQYSTLMEKPCF